ncbi:MAG TPA: DUF362 domain-containing protein [Bacteroidales bacterium]|nr:DUF362 domain-containing protein [Bacteroidales bacterium]
MNSKVAVRECSAYNADLIQEIIADIYTTCGGPPVSGKRVLLKPNLLLDENPEKCITTHPAVIEAMVRFLQNNGATVMIGDSPSIHIRTLRPVRSGLADVCERTGAEWVDFLKRPSSLKLRSGTVRIAAAINEVDLIISLPKLKNHELVYFTGALKNTMGLIPGFTKAAQHALYQDRDRFSSFLINLNDAIPVHFVLMDGIKAMQGKGPAQGFPADTGVLLGSVNPLALDIIASTIVGYDPIAIPTNEIALARGHWLNSQDEIIYDGPDLESLIRKDFIRIPADNFRNIAVKFIRNRLLSVRRLQRRPVFLHDKCIGCRDCIRICPKNAIDMHPVKKNHVVLTDSKCIRCFCCAEVCTSKAIDVRRKPFGV